MSDPIAVDVVQTLVSVNNIDQSIFKTTDKATVAKYWSETFVQNTISEDIYDAIASLSGNSAAVRDSIAWTDLAWDFILDKSNLSETEAELRFQFCGKDFFCKDAPGQGAQVAAPSSAPGEQASQLTPLQVFRKRYSTLRLFLSDLAVPRIEEIFRIRANAACQKDYPQCSSLADYLLEYRTGKYDNQKRALIFTLTNHMWGKECFGMVEKTIMDKLKLRYNNTLVSGAPVKTRRSHGNIKKMINRLRQTRISDRFRVIGIQVHKEVIYQRKLGKPTTGVIQVVKVTRMSHGFDGFLGLCLGHPMLLKIDTAVTPTPKTEQANLLKYLKSLAEEKSTMFADDILEVWAKSNGRVALAPQETEKITQEPQEVSIDSDESTVVSSITHSAPSPESTGTGQKTPETTQTPSAPQPKKNPAGKGRTKTTGSKKTPVGKGCTKKAKQPAVPTTPKKRKSIEDLGAGERSPKRMKNGLYCYGCDHSNVFDLIPYERPYFKESELAKENYPQICSGCKRSLLAGSDKTKHCTIGSVFMVRCCPNSIGNREHSCVFCLCHDCWVKDTANASPAAKKARSGRRAAKRRKISLPGEVVSP